MPIVAPWTSGPSSSSGPQVFQCPLPDEPVAFWQATGGGHEQRPGEVGRRLRQDARRIADLDAAPRARGDIDVVEADGVVADHPELRPGGIEELVVDLVGQQRQGAVDTGDAPQQLVSRRRQVPVPQVDVTRRADEVEALVGQPSRDEDPGDGPLPRESATTETGDEPADPVQGLRQVLARVGVRDADVLAADAAERGPGQHAHIGLGAAGARRTRRRSALSPRCQGRHRRPRAASRT